MKRSVVTALVLSFALHIAAPAAPSYAASRDTRDKAKIVRFLKKIFSIAYLNDGIATPKP